MVDFHDIRVKFESGERSSLPSMMKIRQNFNDDCIDDYRRAVLAQFREFSSSDLSGLSVAVTCGSRHINQIDTITLAVVDSLKERGAEPFIVPSMGSHGNACAEGQVEVLRGYGITEESMGCPIRSSMEVVELGRLDDDTPVYCDKTAFEADGIIVVNRIKVHTDFKGEHESGLLKMMAIGLGNHKGALTLHRRGFKKMAATLPRVAEVFLKRAPILGALAIVENAYDRVMHLELLFPGSIISREKELLALAKERFGRLLMPRIDLLIIDEIGKNISGAGMDPNITGRTPSGLSEGFQTPHIARIAVLGLSKESHGNISGLGLADVTTAAVLEQADLGASYTNALTAGVPAAARIPLVLGTEEEAVRAALHCCPGVSLESARIVRLKNTLEIGEILVSRAVMEDLEGYDCIEVLSGFAPLELGGADF